MYQPEDNGLGNKSTRPHEHDTMEDGGKSSVAASKSVETSDGMQKEFLNSDAAETSLDSEGKITDENEMEATPTTGVPVNDELGDLEFQGFEKCDAEDEDCLASWENCTKYPGHEDFIPLPEFSLQHLPPQFQSEDYLDYIEASANLTVRLKVKVSPHRSLKSGRCLTGTAYIVNAQQGKISFSKEWSFLPEWYFSLVSATHCIFDEYERKNVRVDFFYDSEDSLQGGKAKTLYGVEMVTAYRSKGLCKMICRTYEDDFGRYIQQNLELKKQILSSLRSKPNNSPTSSEEMTENKVMVCISHPHGRPKQVTIGELIGEPDCMTTSSENSEDDYTHRHGTGMRIKSINYDTKTCRGSAGAEMICLDDLATVKDSPPSCTHSRTNQETVEGSPPSCTHSRTNQETELNTGIMECDLPLEILLFNGYQRISSGPVTP